MRIPKEYHTYFWDTDIEKLNWERDKYYITVRFLEYGDFSALRWLQKKFDFEDFLPQLLKSSYARNLSKRILNYWKIILDIERLPWETEEYQKNRERYWIQ
jgi:hypothetical protein